MFIDWRLILLFIAWLFGSGVLGCTSALATDKQMDILNGLASATEQRLKDGSMGQFSGSAQAINPKIKAEVGVVYYAAAGYDGLAGQFSASGAGQLGVLSSEERAQINAIMRDSSLTAQQVRERVFDIVVKAVAK